LTEEGLKATNVGASKSHLDGLFDCFTVDEQTTFGEYLDRIVDSMEKEFGGNVAGFDHCEGGPAHPHDVHFAHHFGRGGGKRGHGGHQGMPSPSQHEYDHDEDNCSQ
jgi:hypothetical protein